MDSSLVVGTTCLPLNAYSSPEEKITLFRSLFRGREDVYARRFVSRRGLAGYSPVCGHEWQRGICEKPRVKCTACLHQRFLPVTDEVIRCHLTGQGEDGQEFVMGLYPLLRDDSCFLLAIDLDKEHWDDDALAVMEVCRELQLPAALERSRSGQGGHVWLFFEEAIPAVLARKLGAHLLTETMERRPEIGLDSYDRLFPSQDTLPQGGLGNLIALPLQKAPRKQGNSLFVDEQLSPHPDQWEYLSSIQRIARSTIESLVSRAERRGRVVGVRLYPTEEDSEPWKSPPSGERKAGGLRLSRHELPKQLDVVLADELYFAKSSLHPSLMNQLIRLAAFQNAEFYKAQSMRLPTFGKPRIIACAEDHGQYLSLPRGCLDGARDLLEGLGVPLHVRDERQFGRPLSLEFTGTLTADQQLAANALLKHETGVLSATTAFGKTVVAAWLMAQRKVNTLILVHRRQLVQQWTERLALFLNLSPDEIGQIGGGRMKRTGAVDVGVIQSLVRKGEVKEWISEYGQILVDECHHLSAPSFERVVRRAKARYILGLSATVTRKDGHHPIILMQCGPVRHRVSAKQQAAIRPFRHTVLVRHTAFRPTTAPAEDARIQFQTLYQELIADSGRNQQICEDVLQSIHDERCPLLLTERNEHLDVLAEHLRTRVEHLYILRGGMGRRQLATVQEQLAAVPEGTPRVLLATGRFIGEGFDDARLDTLFLTLPVSWRGTIAQYVGRLHRLHHGKREVRVYDYADLNVPMLARMFDRRCRGYEAVGYQIQLPASAVPGWPNEVPLPVDPQWKQDHAATVRRLVRDGVNSDLGSLFAAATRSITPSPQSEGADRARSAAEAFLFRRLEMLPRTSGRFVLNAELPIPFDGRGKMEVDLLDQESHLAIELDGPQHLESVEAYRRDRRKDLLLQQQGYLVLRFLTEDVSKGLDKVLDTILSSLESQWKRREPPSFHSIR